MQATYSAILASPLGPLGIQLDNNQLTKLVFLAEDSDILPTSQQSSTIKQIALELNRYFEHPQHIFSLPFSLKGSAFQQRVWQALSRIPSGSTLSYGVLAKQLQTGPRAIGQACRTNPIPIIIPCHRIVASNCLGGYAGAIGGRFLNIKEQLLKHEKS